MQFLNESFVDGNVVPQRQKTWLCGQGQCVLLTLKTLQVLWSFTAFDLLPAELCFMRAAEADTLPRAWYPE